ncbi:uroporphyrinogen-III C-methyltransferase [Nocardioides sp. R-C-SC26]|uniref:uroporphyrinogen-III C-methyltransferase n=1 Tax=Nocardioides sp. R-C-SC26 TaxID=2870414 RepID=UPI001E3A77B1|nr:uroporphyrinogen-III C-methyltransferase [Nocardioides sp. R-C-SC26]
MSENPVYPVGLRLEGRRVVVVGGGQVAQRRIPALIAARAEIVVVAPTVTPAVEGFVGAGEVTWQSREFADDDLDGAWYVIAATDDVSVNERVAMSAEERRVFCVRSDDGYSGSAWTPATGHSDGVTVAVLGRREPRRTSALRDEILEGLRDGRLGRTEAPVRVPGVTLVGGGPGHPELLTIAGRRALMEADVVVADRLAPREAIGDLPPDVEVYDVAKLPRGRSAQQEEINRIIVEQALAGRRVVRFKGGDSFVYGRGYEEVLACRAAGVPVTVIPGISTPIAVPGIAGIPVTHRGVTHEFTVVSGHLAPGNERSLVDWGALARMRGTILLMMAVEHGPQIAAALVEGGRPADTPVAFVCDGSMPTERVVLCTLGDVAATIEREGVQPPAIIVVGDVVAVAHPHHFGGMPAGAENA